MELVEAVTDSFQRDLEGLCRGLVGREGLGGNK